jgi:hypothetical protein
MPITIEQENNILGIVTGLFNAAPGQQFLTEFSNAVESGLTEAQLADVLAAHPVFTDQIMGGQTTTSAQVAILMNHYGLSTTDGVNDSAATQAEEFFSNSIDSNVGFGAIATQVTDFLLGDSVPAEFIETANLFKNKIIAAEIYSASNSSTDLATLQTPLAGLTVFIGTDGADTYTGTSNGDVISGGLDGDKIILEGAQAARDVLVLKIAADSQISDTNADGVITILEDLGFDNIENFKVGATNTDDRVDISNFGFTSNQLGIVDASALVSGFDTDLTSIPDLFDDSGSDRGAAFSEIPLSQGDGGGSQSFLFIDVNGDGDFNAADDMLLELQGAGPLTEAIFIV